MRRLGFEPCIEEKPGLADRWNGSGGCNGFGELCALCRLELEPGGTLHTALKFNRHHPAPVFSVAAAASRELCLGWRSQQRRHHAEADEEYLQC
jgi:hypothetical protein